jgi:ABC-2 type transport system permease protein
MTTLEPSAGVALPRPSGRSLRRLVSTEFTVARRVPVGLVLGVFIPVLLLVVFGSSPGFKKPVNAHTTTTYMTNYVPILMTLTIALIGLVSLPIPMVMNRERKYLRRLSATPVSPVWLLGAQVAVNLAMAVVAMGLIVGGSVILYNVQAPAQVGGFLLSAALAVASLFALGLFIAAIAPTPPVAGVLGTALLYPLLYFAGLWIPRQNMAPTLRHIGDFTPLGAAVQSLLASIQGSFPPTHALVVMAVWALVFGFAAVKLFRWE